ncbi:hypothetical protein AMECASPLE_007839, partial [Ameca splendens]
MFLLWVFRTSYSRLPNVSRSAKRQGPLADMGELTDHCEKFSAPSTLFGQLPSWLLPGYSPTPKSSTACPPSNALKPRHNSCPSDSAYLLTTTSVLSFHDS